MVTLPEVEHSSLSGVMTNCCGDVETDKVDRLATVDALGRGWEEPEGFLALMLRRRSWSACPVWARRDQHSTSFRGPPRTSRTR